MQNVLGLFSAPLLHSNVDFSRLPEPRKLSLLHVFALACGDMPHLKIKFSIFNVDKPTTEQIEQVARVFLQHDGYRFKIGKRLLEFACDPVGQLWPPAGYRLCIENEPSEDEKRYPCWLEEWSIDLVKEDGKPPYWGAYGQMIGAFFDELSGDRILNVTADKKWLAIENIGFVMLGRRMWW